jgi:hypothetical protein
VATGHVDYLSNQIKKKDIKGRLAVNENNAVALLLISIFLFMKAKQ